MKWKYVNTCLKPPTRYSVDGWIQGCSLFLPGNPGTFQPYLRATGLDLATARGHQVLILAARIKLND
jgi:hypothetical protein